MNSVSPHDAPPFSDGSNAQRSTLADLQALFLQIDLAQDDEDLQISLLMELEALLLKLESASHDSVEAGDAASSGAIVEPDLAGRGDVVDDDDDIQFPVEEFFGPRPQENGYEDIQFPVEEFFGTEAQANGYEDIQFPVEEFFGTEAQANGYEDIQFPVEEFFGTGTQSGLGGQAEELLATDFETEGPELDIEDQDDLDELNEIEASLGASTAADFDASDLTEQELARTVDDMIALFDSVYDPELLDPVQYINRSIRQIVDSSSASEKLKNSINEKTPINVSYMPKPPASGGLVGSDALFGAIDTIIGHRKDKTYTLDEIVTDAFRRELNGHAHVQVQWPSNYPQDLVQALDSADLQSRYQADIEQRLNTPNARYMLQLQARVEVQDRLDHYVKRPHTPESMKQLVDAYTRGDAKLQTIEFRTRLWKADVAQALYLSWPDAKSATGLLIFLDAEQDQAVFALPGTNRRAFIEHSPWLARLITQRLPLYAQIRKGNGPLAYWITQIGPYPTRFPPLNFLDTDDAFAALHGIRIKRMLADIDTLVSTDNERLTDQWLEAGMYMLQGLSLIATLPLGPGAVSVRLLVSFLLGYSAVALQALRGANADIPEEANAHYRAALFGAILELVGPIAGKLVGKAVSAASRSSIARSVYRYMRKTRSFPGQAAPYKRLRLDPTEVARARRTVVNELSKGPDQAQALVNQNSQLINRTVEGHDLVIYRGRVFRGDMRAPDEVFKKGFELRTPAEEIQKDIHKVTGVRGGFGGGHDALDPDGKGISTSVYYYRNNVGAYVYGGQKGGYTYLIDARKFDGYHLYQNHYNASYPNAKPIKFSPTEINYGHGIPGTAILGAYDAAGRFIANTVGIRIYARELAIKELRRLATLAVAAAVSPPVPESA
ncbi:hypothetical protein [Pseudomonas sp. UBA1879]|uniref:hypothetical protein n=1 Tax=Pseudomonas sp. UBA1879 TaxID=1947305 RepID=UPI0025D37E71|nr:hypothetical protein [Pseudomonas sp. UBA1879]